MITNKSIRLKNTHDYIIYKITNHLGDVYIGATTNIEHRLKTYREHPCVFKNQKLLYQSIIKYEWHTHQVSILKKYTSDNSLIIDEVSRIEQEYIFREYTKNPDKILNIAIDGLKRGWNTKNV